jgi:peroxiredoxin (alkyl hydroperoxide reductase subunit C)
MKEEKIGCAKPKQEPQEVIVNSSITKSFKPLVGNRAPDFNAQVYHKGIFSSIKLSELVGKWVMLCFYPGDFTFV